MSTGPANSTEAANVVAVANTAAAAAASANATVAAATFNVDASTFHGGPLDDPTPKPFKSLGVDDGSGYGTGFVGPTLSGVVVKEPYF